MLGTRSKTRTSRSSSNSPVLMNQNNKRRESNVKTQFSHSVFSRFPKVTTAVLKSVCLNEVHGTEAHDILCEDDLESTLIGNEGILGISFLPFGLSREIRSFNKVVSYLYFRPEWKEKLH